MQRKLVRRFCRQTEQKRTHYQAIEHVDPIIDLFTRRGETSRAGMRLQAERTTTEMIKFAVTMLSGTANDRGRLLLLNVGVTKSFHEKDMRRRSGRLPPGMATQPGIATGMT